MDEGLEHVIPAHVLSPPCEAGLPTAWLQAVCFQGLHSIYVDSEKRGASYPWKGVWPAGGLWATENCFSPSRSSALWG